MNKPIFISYKRADKDRVLPIKEYIENETGTECWIDLEGIESDAYFMNVIIKAINECDVFIFMYSKTHEKVKDTERDWTIREIGFAEKKHKHIVILKLDDYDLIDYLYMQYQFKQQILVDDDYNMKNLIHDIKKWLGSSNKDSSDITEGVEDISENKRDLKIFSNLWSKTQEAVVKSQEAYQKIAPNVKNWINGKEDGFPKSIAIKVNKEKIYFILSEDGSYYLANLNSKTGNFAWWNNKLILAAGATALLGGAYIVVPIGLGIAGLSKMLFKKKPLNIFSAIKDDDKTSNIEVTEQLCRELSKSSGYVIAIPSHEELKDVSDDAKSSCVVIRVKDNPEIQKLVCIN